MQNSSSLVLLAPHYFHYEISVDDSELAEVTLCQQCQLACNSQWPKPLNGASLQNKGASFKLPGGNNVGLD